MSLGTKRHLVLIVLTVAALAVLAPSGRSELVYAGHSAEAPYFYWDTNLDGFPDPNQTFYADSDFGGNWTSTQVFRFADAATEWRGDTSYNPTGTIATSSCITRCAYLSSTSRCPLPTGYRAATCKQSTYYPANYFPGAPAHHRLTRTWINFNTSGFKFHYGTGAPPDSSYSDFQGVATHEVGHTVWLVDLGTDEGCDYSSASLWTMCTGGSNSTTYRRRSLESDDVSAANEVY